MEDGEVLKKRKVAVVATAHAAATNVVNTTYFALDIPKEPHIDKNEERQKYMDSILENDSNCRAHLQMGVDAFHKLCNLFRKKRIMNDNQNSKLEEIVMRFLYILGHNERHRALEGMFYRSRETISRQFNETLNCVIKLYKYLVADHLKAVHGGGTPLQITRDPRFAEYFKDCVGALDGIHIDATVPVDEQDIFQGQKSKATQNVLAACSFDLKFTYVLAGWEGSVDDQRVLDDAVARSNPFVVPTGKYYLVDADYTHQPGFLAPYHGTPYHTSRCQVRIPENEKELFNQRHAFLRNTIERAFRVVKKRWSLLSTDSFYPFKTQVKIVLACFVLHNHIMECDPDSSILEEVDKELNANPTVESVGEETSTSVMPCASPEGSWTLLRDEIAHKMYEDYTRPGNVQDNV